MTQTKLTRALTWLLLIGSFLPYAWKLPYMTNAWRSSPMDRFDWLFLLLAAVALLATLRVLLARRSRTQCVYLVALLPSLLLMALGVALEIHAAAIMGAVAFSWSMLWFALGWRSAYTAVPIYAIMGLSCTSTSYWLGYFSGSLQWNGLAIKGVLTLLLLAWLLHNVFRERQVRRETFCFYLAFAVLIFSAWQARTLYRTAAPFLPDFHTLDRGEFFGQAMEITPADERFFGASDIGKYIFASDDSIVTVLAVTCVDDIHQIHPASHCLRVSGWAIDAENIDSVDVASQRLYVSEIIARRDGQRIMVWVWYSSADASTGNFLAFRRLWRQGTPWFTAQVSTPCAQGTENDARAVLSKFLAITTP